MCEKKSHAGWGWREKVCRFYLYGTPVFSVFWVFFYSFSCRRMSSLMPLSLRKNQHFSVQQVSNIIFGTAWDGVEFLSKTAVGLRQFETCTNNNNNNNKDDSKQKPVEGHWPMHQEAPGGPEGGVRASWHAVWNIESPHATKKHKNNKQKQAKHNKHKLSRHGWRNIKVLVKAQPVGPQTQASVPGQAPAAFHGDF